MPKEFEQQKQNVLDAYSQIVGYPVQELSKMRVRELRKINSTDYYIVQVERVQEQWRSRCRGSNRKKTIPVSALLLNFRKKIKKNYMEQ